MGDACGVTQGCVNCGCAGIALGFGNCGWDSGDCCLGATFCEQFKIDEAVSVLCPQGSELPGDAPLLDCS